MEIKSYSMNWHYPTAVRVGAGRISELPKACRQLGMTSPLLGGLNAPAPTKT